MYKLLIVINIFVAVAAQIFVKLGMKKVGQVELDTGILTNLKKMAVNPYLWLAVIVYFVSFTLYAIILSKADLNKAYPIVLIGGIILTFAVSILFFNESINPYQIIGLILCIVGFIFLFYAL